MSESGASKATGYGRRAGNEEGVLLVVREARCAVYLCGWSVLDEMCRYLAGEEADEQRKIKRTTHW